MDFTLSETQALMVDVVSSLVADHHDFDARRAILASGLCGSEAFWERLASVGLLGVELDEVHGGTGGTFEDIAVMLQPLGRALMIDPVVATVVLGAGLVNRAGTAVQKTAVLPAVADGSLKLAVAHGEAGNDRTPERIATRAERVDNGWTLTGAKAVVPGGHAAGLFIVSAQTTEGPSLFLVPRDTRGLTVRPYPLYDGSGAADLVLDAVRPGDEALLGEVGEGLDHVTWAWDRGAAAVCNEAVGVMAALCDLTLDYLKSRVQFGRPIGGFQVLQHRMVDMRIALEQARSMAMLAAVAADDPDPAKRSRAVSAAKVTVGRACRQIGQSAVQLHGGIALTDDYIAGHYFKRLTLIERQFGDTASHLARFARTPG